MNRLPKAKLPSSTGVDLDPSAKTRMIVGAP